MVIQRRNFVTGEDSLDGILGPFRKLLGILLPGGEVLIAEYGWGKQGLTAEIVEGMRIQQKITLGAHTPYTIDAQ